MSKHIPAGAALASVHLAVPQAGNPSLRLPRAPVAAGAFAMGAHKTRRSRSPVPRFRGMSADEIFSSVNYLTLPDRFLNDAGERGRMGCWEMSVRQEALPAAEGA
jgi:hypothetical protein